MVRLILVLNLLFYSFAAQANYPYFHFDNQQVKLSNESFRRYVRPQVRSIISEYSHLLKKINPLQGDLIKIRNQILKLSLKWEDWNQKCKIITEDCIEPLSEFYKLARDLDKSVLLIEKDQLTFKGIKNSNEIDSIINLSRKLDIISNINYKILHYLEEILITVNTSYYYVFSPKDFFSPLLHDMLLSSEMILTSLMEKKFSASFDSLWVEFIKVLEKKVVIERDKKFLVENLGQLNLQWNSFHMKMVKSNMGFQKSLHSVITVMHNRWNSILKLILNSTRIQ